MRGFKQSPLIFLESRDMSLPLANAAFLSKREILGPAAIYNFTCTCTCNLEAYPPGVISVRSSLFFTSISMVYSTLHIVRGCCVKAHMPAGR